MRVERLSHDRVRVLAPAKLNLYLEILFKRADGYHELETVMHSIDLSDEFVVERTAGSGIEIAIRGYPAPVDGSNLIAKAAERYFLVFHRRFGLKIDLQKNIPAGAGLGGGSADAAGMLLALHTLDSPATTSNSRSDAIAALTPIAEEIGSDVPFFLTGGTAIARGRGEKIEALSSEQSPNFTFVVVFPRVQSPTPLIYKSLTSDLTEHKRDLHRFLSSLDSATDRRAPPFWNRLAAPFRRVFPELARLQDSISNETGRAFHVSGSGSALYAVVADAQEGERVRTKLQAMAAGDIFLTRSLPRQGNEPRSW